MSVGGASVGGEGDRDRVAVEVVRGRPLPHEWPADALPVGTRVQVVQAEDWAGPWARVFAGRISNMGAPEAPESVLAMPGELAYWVDFDESQMDAAGDGPYRKAWIWARYLRKIRQHGRFEWGGRDVPVRLAMGR
jgi:hypothetical protein